MAAETEKELQLLKKRFAELAEKSYMQNIYTFTGFLSLAQQEALYQVMEQKGFRAFTLQGGGGDCERRMARFGSPEEMGYEEAFPIVPVKISPLLEKFSDELTHRDYLGAIMNLGIERNTLGDIFIEGKHAFVYCMERIAPFLCENLTKVRHTSVRCQRAEEDPALSAGEPEQMGLIVSGVRVDAVLAGVYGLSRSRSLELFSGKKVYINGRLCENNSYMLREGDRVSVRGYGRFLFYGVSGETRKGRLNVTVGVYR